MQLPDKHRVLEALLNELSALAAHMTEAAKKTVEGATHEEAKPENDKDTRALEQTYLARGQAMRVEELLEQIQFLRFMPLPALSDGDPISAGALVLLASDDGERCLFFSPHGGGTEIMVDGVEVLVVTPISPMGKAVLGRSTGDEVELRVRGKLREYEIASVR